MEGLTYWVPKGAIVIEGQWDKDSSDWAIKIAPYIDADTSSPHWRLTRKVNHLFEDNVTLEVDATTGLLQTVGGTSEDKTAAIAAQGIALAAKVMTMGVGGGPVTALEKRRPSEAPPVPPRIPCGKSIDLKGSFRYMIASDDLPKHGGQETRRTLVVSAPPTQSSAGDSTGKGTPTPTATATPTATPYSRAYCVIVRREDTAGPPESNQGRIRDLSDGIVVRAPVPYLLTIKPLERPDLQAEQLVFLPDTQRDYYLPLDRSPFVKNDTQITLIKGVVQKVSVTRPSIVLGILGVPKTILDALVPLPH